MPNDPSTDVAIIPEPDFSAIAASQNSKAVFLPGTLKEAMELAHFMAGGIGVRPWMRGNPSACLALIQISMRWGMDPYIVANKAYYTNDTLAFESQLVAAVINSSGQLLGRLKFEYAGDAGGQVGQETLNCRVTGRVKSAPDDLKVLDQPLCDIKIRNSPLWKVNPKLQLAYHAQRSWARLYMPEVLLGIYTPDEIADGAAEQAQARTDVRDATVKAPDRRQFVGVSTDAAPADREIQDAEIEEVAEEAEPSGNRVDTDEVERDPVSVQSQPVADDSGASDLLTGVDDGQPVDILDRVPVGDVEWMEWRNKAKAEIEGTTDLTAFRNIRARLAPAMEAASNSVLEEAQEWLSDQYVKLPEEQK